MQPCVNMPFYTRRQWVTIILFSLAQFCNAACVSLQAPFYPAEAEKKGATASQYGLVFGSFDLTVFLVSPIYGKFMNKWGAKFINNAGIFTVSIMCILFGFLDRMDTTALFIGFSFAIRIVEAMGNAAFVTSAFSIIAKEFPKNVGAAFATMETFFGLGLIVGPTVGGALYELGGYTLPFVSLGSVLLGAAIMTSCLLPSTGADATPESLGSRGQFSSALRIPSIILMCLALLSSSISIGFLQATLEPHLRPLNLSPFKLGLMFVLSGLMYAITTPCWGSLCDKLVPPRIITTLGTVVVVIAFIFVGPMPFIPLETTLPLCIGSLVVHGIGLGAVFVSTFSGCHREVIANGFHDDLHTYGLVSGMWTSTFAFGCFIGPSVGGVLLDLVGFKWASVFVAALHALVALSLGIFIFFMESGKEVLRTNVHDSLSQAKDELHGLLSHVDGECDSTYGSARSSQKNLLSIP